MDLFRGTWPWWIGGPLLGLIVPVIYWYGGKKWGVSSTLRHICAALAPSGLEYFQYDWKSRGTWQLLMAAGLILGGWVASTFLGAGDTIVPISERTWVALNDLGIPTQEGLAPVQLFSWSALKGRGLIFMVAGGFLVGFGARYANGCTSGHAISGLATLQRSSLAAVVGFFIGGLISTHLLLGIFL